MPPWRSRVVRDDVPRAGPLVLDLARRPTSSSPRGTEQVAREVLAFGDDRADRGLLDRQRALVDDGLRAGCGAARAGSGRRRRGSSESSLLRGRRRASPPLVEAGDVGRRDPHRRVAARRPAPGRRRRSPPAACRAANTGTSTRPGASRQMDLAVRDGSAAPAAHACVARRPRRPPGTTGAAPSARCRSPASVIDLDRDPHRDAHRRRSAARTRRGTRRQRPDERATRRASHAIGMPSSAPWRSKRTSASSRTVQPRDPLRRRRGRRATASRSAASVGSSTLAAPPGSRSATDCARSRCSGRGRRAERAQHRREVRHDGAPRADVTGDVAREQTAAAAVGEEREVGGGTSPRLAIRLRTARAIVASATSRMPQAVSTGSSPTCAPTRAHAGRARATSSGIRPPRKRPGRGTRGRPARR